MNSARRYIRGEKKTADQESSYQSLATSLDRYPSLKKLVAERLQQEASEDVEKEMTTKGSAIISGDNRGNANGSNTALDDEEHASFFLDGLKRAQEERRNKLRKCFQAFTA